LLIYLGLFDLIDCIEVWECCLRQRSTLYFAAPGGDAVSAALRVLVFSASGGGHSGVMCGNVCSERQASFTTLIFSASVGDTLRRPRCDLCVIIFTIKHVYNLLYVNTH
jgi:hypothetical protein